MFRERRFSINTENSFHYFIYRKTKKRNYLKNGDE